MSANTVDPPLGSDGPSCRICGATPAVATTIRGHRGLFVFMRLPKNQGPFCRTCGTAVNRDMTSKTLWEGGWTFGSPILVPFVLISNAVQRRKILQLAPPAPGFPRRPLDPGKPVLRRPDTFLFLLPVVIVAAVVVTIVTGRNDASEAKAGDCVKKTGTNSIKVVDCGSADAEYKVLSRSNGTFDGCQYNKKATASYEETNSVEAFVLCLTDVG